MSKLFCARLRSIWSSISSARAARRSQSRAAPRRDSASFPLPRNALAQRRCAREQLCDVRPTALLCVRDFQVPR